MNVKLHTPKTLKTGSGISSFKQFMLSLIATSVSIILTFGTAAVIDHRKKQAAKKEIVMMVLNDFDKTIEQVMAADSIFSQASLVEQELAVHPEYFDSLRHKFMPAIEQIETNFPETTEKIFSSSIETFNTIGNVNFVNEVSSFYIYRNKYKQSVLDQLRIEIDGHEPLSSLKDLFNISFPEHAFISWTFAQMLKESRDKCMHMMNISEQDLKSFSEQQYIGNELTPEEQAKQSAKTEEFRKAMNLIHQAEEKLKD